MKSSWFILAARQKSYQQFGFWDSGACCIARYVRPLTDLASLKMEAAAAVSIQQQNNQSYNRLDLQPHRGRHAAGLVLGTC